MGGAGGHREAGVCCQGPEDRRGDRVVVCGGEVDSVERSGQISHDVDRDRFVAQLGVDGAFGGVEQSRLGAPPGGVSIARGCVAASPGALQAPMARNLAPAVPSATV